MRKQELILGTFLDRVYLGENRQFLGELAIEIANLYKIIDRLVANDSITFEEYHQFEDGFNIQYRDFIQYLNTLDMNINIVLAMTKEPSKESQTTELENDK
ncbi:MAG: hypothetical protein R3Y32_08710 [Bacillota bacterium]